VRIRDGLIAAYEGRKVRVRVPQVLMQCVCQRLGVTSYPLDGGQYLMQ